MNYSQSGVKAEFVEVRVIYRKRDGKLSMSRSAKPYLNPFNTLAEFADAFFGFCGNDVFAIIIDDREIFVYEKAS